MKTNENELTTAEARFFEAALRRGLAANPKATMEEAITTGMTLELAFEDELLENATPRAKMARKAIGAAVFAQINIQNAIESMERGA